MSLLHTSNLNEPEPLKIVLKNGTRILVHPDPRFASVHLVVTLTGGLRDESDNLLGLTHLLEHLIFKRTTTRDARAIANMMDSLGGDINATTDVDTMNLYGTFRGRDLDAALTFFAELLCDANFQDEDVELEREVVRQEVLEALDSPAELVYLGLSEQMWAGNKLGKAVFGNLESLARIEIEDLRARLRELLVGQRLVIAVAGNVETESFIGHVESLFGQLTNGEVPRYETPAHHSGYDSIVRPIKQSYLALALSWPGAATKEYITGTLLASVLGSGSSSRLFQVLREQHGLAYDIGASLDSYPDISALLISGVFERKNIDRALRMIFQELDRLRTEGVEDGELALVKEVLSAQIELSGDSLGGRLGRLMEGELIHGRYIKAEELLSEVIAVSKADLQQFADRHLSEFAYSLFLGGDVAKFEVSDRILKRVKVAGQ